MTIAFRLRAVGVHAGSILRPRPSDTDTLTSSAALRSDFVSRVFLGDTDGVTAALAGAPVGYNEVDLSWWIDSTQITWTEAWVVRNGFGTPFSIQDGMIVHHFTPTTASKFIVDPALTGGRYYYYALFARVTGSSPPVLLLAHSDVLLPRDYGTSDYLWSRIPEYYRQADDAQGPDTGGPLRRFMHFMGYEMDRCRTAAETVEGARSIDRVPGSMLPMLGEQFGQPYEAHMSASRYRHLVGEISRLRRSRGTTAALRGYVQALSGYRTTIARGINLVLNSDDADGAGALSNWVVASGTGTLSTGTGTGPVGASYFTVTPSALPGSGSFTVALGWNPPLDLIPVTPGATYTFSLYLKSGTVGIQVRPQADFYDNHGQTPSNVQSITVLTPSTSAFTRYEWQVTVPANKYYARIGFLLPNITVGQVMQWGGVQVELAGSATTYERPRLVKVNIRPQRINLAKNPKFVSTSWWSLPTTATSDGASVTMTPPLVGTGTTYGYEYPAVPTGTSTTSGSSSRGTKFTVAAGNGIIVTGVRLYRTTTDAVTAHTFKVWSAAGALLGTTTATVGESGTGWVTANFATPVTIAGGAQFVVSGDFNETIIWKSLGFPVTTVGRLTGVAGLTGANGAFPTSVSTSDWFIEPVVQNLDPATAVSVTTPLMQIESGGNYTYSLVVSSLVTTAVTLGAEFWLDPLGSTTSVSPLTAGPYTILPGTQVMTFTNVIAPSEAVLARMALTFTIPVGGSVTLSKALIEKDSTAGYFDGDTDTGANGDFWWAGTANASVSYYNANKVVTTGRLLATIPDWLPFDMQALLAWDLSSNAAPAAIGGGPYFTVGDTTYGVIEGAYAIR